MSEPQIYADDAVPKSAESEKSESESAGVKGLTGMIKYPVMIKGETENGKYAHAKQQSGKDG
ncbi:MAG: hypothetical protein V2I97_16570 [Desulfococcaceae bacterium]|jgi:hypothetical protein|nr:hypothetical protein [Desulfococcaceae bacterium]